MELTLEALASKIAALEADNQRLATELATAKNSHSGLQGHVKSLREEMLAAFQSAKDEVGSVKNEFLPKLEEMQQGFQTVTEQVGGVTKAITVQQRTATIQKLVATKYPLLADLLESGQFENLKETPDDQIETMLAGYNTAITAVIEKHKGKMVEGAVPNQSSGATPTTGATIRSVGEIFEQMDKVAVGTKEYDALMQEYYAALEKG